MTTKKENDFQAQLIKDLEALFEGAVIFKGNSKVRQGIPDLIILWKKHWALLECKASASAEHQPNQDWYVQRLNEMSFSAFIYPDNKEEVLHALQHAFGTLRVPRVSKR